jgi:general secretion pathway protein D
MTIKQVFFFIQLFCLVFLPVSSISAADFIDEVEFNETQLADVVRTLSELTNTNIIATPEATDRQLTIHLKNVSVLDAVKSISRISNLWYRYDEDTNTYRIMTREEYSQDLVVRESEHIEVFTLLNANVQIIAQAIEDLYGRRVILSLGQAPGEDAFGSGGRTGSSGVGRSNSTVRNVRSSNRGGIGRSTNRSSGGRAGAGNTLTPAGSQLDGTILTVDQISQLAASVEASGSNNISQETLKEVTIQSQPIYVTVNNEHNMIIVRTDDKAVLGSIEKLIKKMDIPVPQVMLEMQILSVILGEDFNSIFNFELQPSGSNQSSQPILLGNNALLNSGTFIYEFLNNRLRANLEFLEENRRVRVLSNPMVVASNHREAELFIGEETLVTEGFQFFASVIDNGVVIQPAYVQALVNREDIGITLRITPRINSDSTVSLQLEQESSTVNVGGGTIPVTDGQGGVTNLAVDTINTARLTGTVMAKDGLTVAVGGLIRTSVNKNERKVPLLGEIPVIGRVFRSTIESEEDTETVLLITPRIMNAPGESEKIRQADNPYYRSHNAGYPPPAPAPNRFIDRDNSDDIVTTPATQAESPDPIVKERHQVYMEMSQYAAETVRIPEVERLRDKNYSPVRVNTQSSQPLFNDNRISATPVGSWNRGGMHVTALSVVNRSSQTLPVDYQNIKGRWLASSVENSRLSAMGQPESSTYMYLISALPFEEVVANAR